MRYNKVVYRFRGLCLLRKSLHLGMSQQTCNTLSAQANASQRQGTIGHSLFLVYFSLLRSLDSIEAQVISCFKINFIILHLIIVFISFDEEESVRL